MPTGGGGGGGEYTLILLFMFQDPMNIKRLPPLPIELFSFFFDIAYGALRHESNKKNCFIFGGRYVRSRSTKFWG